MQNSGAISLVETLVVCKRRNILRWTLLAFAFLALSLFASPRAYAQSCSGTGAGGCQQVTCAQGATTAVSGTVYAPNGVDPLPNILVYVPTTTLNVFKDGITSPTVDSFANLVSGSPLVQTTTLANGTFTLNNVPPGSDIPLVIQAGRWRREFVISTVASCVTTPLTASAPFTQTQGGSSSLASHGEGTSIRFAGNQGEGDIPKIAMVTGKVDAAECTLRKMGIADSEFTNYTTNISGGSEPGRVSLFTGSSSAGAEINSSTPTEDTLMGNAIGTYSSSVPLSGFNVLMLPCQGESSAPVGADGLSNFLAFVNNGGRASVTHKSGYYLNTNFPAAASWDVSGLSSLADDPDVATINNSFSSGSTLANWLQDMGATSTLGDVSISTLKLDQYGVNSPAQVWLNYNGAAVTIGGHTVTDPAMMFSFYAPWGNAADAQYGRVMFYEYHVDNASVSSSSTASEGGGNPGNVFPNECVNDSNSDRALATGTAAESPTTNMSAQEHMLEYSLFDLMNFAVPVVSTNVSLGITTSTLAGVSTGTFTGGQDYTVGVSVTNNGTSAITTIPTVTLAVTLPAGLTPVAMTDPLGNWSCNVSTLTCTLLNSLAAGANNSISLAVSVAANVTAGSAPIGATVSSAGFVASTTDNVDLTVDAAPAGTVTGPAETGVPPTEVGTTTPTVGTVTFDVSAGTTISSILVVTEGYTGKDFTNAGSGTCTVKTYGSATSCTVIVNFSPLDPGQRNGAIEILGPGNTLLDTAYISGIGIAPEAIFLPGTQSTVASGSASNSFDDVAVDLLGNVYIADYANSQILKETLASGSYTPSTAFNTLSGPAGIAIDGAGNLYIADATGNQVLKQTLVSGSYTQSTIGSGLSSPSGVAVDGSGNVYIADSGNDRILLETLSGSTYIQSVIVSGLSNPARVAVDENGDVFVADTGNNRVIVETLSGGAYTQSVVASSLSAPSGVAVDGNGNVYIADTGNNRVIEEQLVSGSYVASTLVTGLNAPHGLTVDEHGNLYIADHGDSKLYRQDYSDPPSLTFASTTPGVASSDSPQTVTLENFGNAALNAVAPGITAPSDFPQATGNEGDCSAAFSLTASGSCSLRIEFDPATLGSKSESFVLTDNNLNSASTTQTIAVSGPAAPAVTIVISPGSLAAPVIGSSYSQTLTASGGTSPYTFTVIGGSLPAGLSLTSGGVLSGTPTAVGTFTFTVQATDSSDYTGTLSFTVTIAAPTVVVSPSTLPNGTYGSSYSQPISASGGSGTYSYAVSSGSLAAGLSLNSSTGALTGTPTAAGSATFTVTATDTVTTGPAAPYVGSQAYTLVINKAAATVSLSNLTQTYAGSALTPTATTTPSGLSVTWSGAPDTAAGSYPVTATINDPNYTGSASGTFVINKATATVTLSNLTQTYTGSALTPTATTAPSGLSVTWSGAPDTAAGSYPVTATINDPNYTGSASGTFVINKATATVTLSNLTQTYDGLPEPATVSTSPTGLVLSYSYVGINSTSYGPSATAPTAPGTYTVTVTVVDPNYAGFNSGTLTINQLNPNLTLAAASGAPANPPYGTNLAFYATLSPTAVCPTGTVSFYVDGSATAAYSVNISTLPVCTLGSPESIEFQTASLTPGSHTLTATYGGDTNYQGPTTTPGLAQQIVADGTAVSLATTALSPYVGDPVTFTATVTPAAGSPAQVPGGTVTFNEVDSSGTLISTLASGVALSATAPYTASSGTSFSPAGPYYVQVVFVDTDGDYLGSSSVQTEEAVSQKTPTINWTPTVATIGYGTALGPNQLNATATDPETADTVPGTYSYVPGTGSVQNAGPVQLQLNFTPNDTITYANNSATTTINVQPATLTVTPAAQSMTYGGEVPELTFSYNGLVNGDGPAVLTTAPTCSTTATSSSPAGSYPITCSGGAAANYNIGYGTANVTVNQASVTITASSPTVSYGSTAPTVTPGYSGFVSEDNSSLLTTQPTCTTTYTASSTVGSSTTTSCSGAAAANYTFSYVNGSVTVNKATPTIGTAPSATAISDGQALSASTLSSGAAQNPNNSNPVAGSFAFTTPATTPGPGTPSESVTFTPADTTDYNTASTSVEVTVNRAAGADVLSSSNTTPTSGQSVTLTDTIPMVNGVAPTGAVSFYSGSTLLGTAAVNASGVATLTTTALPVGTDSVTAVLAADANYAQVTSNIATETVIDFAIAATPSSQTVNPGAGASYTIALSGVSGAFGMPVTLTVTGLPPGATVSFGKLSYVPGVGPTPTTMTVVTSATQGRVRPAGNSSELVYALFFLPLLGSRKVRRKLQQMPGSVVMFLLALALIGGVATTTSCGGGYFGASPQQYTITVTGTSGTLSHSTAVTLTVQ